MKTTREKKKVDNEKLIKSAKKVRSIIMMTLICIMLLTAATYAWFKLSDSARVTNLALTVSGENGLLIAPAATANTPGTYTGQLKFGTDIDGSVGNGVKYQINGKLLPATTTDGRSFRKPVYDANDGSIVTGVSALASGEGRLTSASSSNGEGYYYETVFWLKAVSSGDIKVTLADKNAGGEGTYTTVENSTKANGAAAVRMSFTTDRNETLVYEPNADVTPGTGYTSAKDNSRAAAYSDTMKQTSAGKFTNTKTLTISNTGTKVTMRIWIEGTDTMCVNEIMAEQIQAQLQFQIVN